MEVHAAAEALGTYWSLFNGLTPGSAAFSSDICCALLQEETGALSIATDLLWNDGNVLVLLRV